MKAERQKGERAALSRGRTIVLSVIAVIVAVAVVEGFAATSVNRGPSGRSHSSTPTKHVKAVGTLHLLAQFPASGADDVSYASSVDLDFSLPLAQHIPMPTLTPSLPGTWSRSSPKRLVFHPAGFFVPLEQISVHVPGGTKGIRSKSGAMLTSSLSTSFTIEDVPVLRLQQLLAELGYLPVNFTRTNAAGPSGPTGAPTTYPAPVTTTGPAADPASALADEPTRPDAISLEPETGSFQWRYASTPSQLASLWVPGAWNVVTEGALMAFEADHNLYIDGVPGPTVWAALLDAVATRDVTTRPYTYLMVTETLPETLYVWRGGQVVFQTPVNTGVYRATTPLGTWPVYLRFTSVTMKGTNPDGTKYDDPGVPWVSYFYESDAVHGFLRSGYGYPQSDGCVELPYSSAETVFPLDTYGTLVTVTTGDLWQPLGTTAPAPLYIPTTTTTTTTTTTLPVGTY